MTRRPTKRAADRFEVHEHSDPKTGRTIEHSHPGGEHPHRHEGWGRSCYTIDRAEWAAATGLKGGGRKRFTPFPEGLALIPLPLDEDELTLNVVVVGDGGAAIAGRSGREATGGGMYAAERMQQRFGMRAVVTHVPAGAPIPMPRGLKGKAKP